MEFFDPILVLAGFIVGMGVGLSGVGGGALMTPFLIFYGISPSIAIGTDLLYAAITKGGGLLCHHYQGSIEWPIVIMMLLGSIPASLTTLYILDTLHLGESNRIITTILAITLFATAMMLFIPVKRDLTKEPSSTPPRFGGILTIFLGMVIGTLVTITSIGAGALGAALLVLLYPMLPMVKIVGSDIAHALPLVLIASLGHLYMGNVELQLLIVLLIGSLPGVAIGSRFSGVICETVMRRVLASVLLIIAVGLLNI